MGAEIESIKRTVVGEKIVARKEGAEAGRVYVYFLNNDLHRRPFAFIEDVFVGKESRGEGLGIKLVEEAINRAREKGCYKIVLTARYSKRKVHLMYRKLGFTDHGKEFRMNL